MPQRYQEFRSYTNFPFAFGLCFTNFLETVGFRAEKVLLSESGFIGLGDYWTQFFQSINPLIQKIQIQTINYALSTS